LQLLHLLSAQQNREKLQAVLDFAECHSNAFWDSQFSRAESEEAAPDFPFLNTCIAVASFFPEAGQDAFSEPEPTFSPQHLDINEGMTIIDITQVDKIMYGFADHELSINTATEVAEERSLDTELATRIEEWGLINGEVIGSLPGRGSVHSDATEPDLTETGSRKRKRSLDYEGSQSRARPKENMSSKPVRLNQMFSIPFQSPDQVPHSDTDGCVAQIMYLSYRPELDASPTFGGGIPWSSLPHGNCHQNWLGQGFGPGSVVSCNIPLGKLSQGQFVRLTRLFLTYLAYSRTTPTASRVAMAAAKSFSLVSDGLDDSQSRVGPFPLSIYPNAIDLHHDPDGAPPKLKRIVVKRWTLLIVHEQSYFRDQPEAEVFRYAFITPQSTCKQPPSAAGWHPPEKPQTVDGITFLRATSEASSTSTNDPQSVIKEWNDIVQKFKPTTCEQEELAEIIKAMVRYSRRSHSISRLYKTVLNHEFFEVTEETLRQQISEEFELEVKQMSPKTHQQFFKSIFGLRWLQSRSKDSKVSRRAWNSAWDNETIYALVICLITMSLIAEPQVMQSYRESSGIAPIDTDPDKIFLRALDGELSGFAPCLMRLTPLEKRVIVKALMLKSEGFEDLQLGIPVVRVCCLLQISQYLGQQLETYAESLSDGAYKQCALLFMKGASVTRKEDHDWLDTLTSDLRRTATLPILKIGKFAVAREDIGMQIAP
jgi:hypothetical protein